MEEEGFEDIKETKLPLPEGTHEASIIAAVHGSATTTEDKPVAEPGLATNNSVIMDHVNDNCLMVKPVLATNNSVIMDHVNDNCLMTKPAAESASESTTNPVIIDKINDNCSMEVNKMKNQSGLSTAIFLSKESVEAALLEAAMKDDALTAKKALDAGANPDCSGWLGKTPLHCATVANHYDIVFLLLEAGASIEKKDNDGWTALHYAAFKNNVDCASLLIERGASPNARNWLGKTPLRIALENNQLLVASLIKRCGGQDSCTIL